MSTSNSKGTVLGIAALVLTIALSVAGFGLLVAQVPHRVIDRAVHALMADRARRVERAAAEPAPAATEAEQASESTTPVIAYTFSDEEGLVIVGCQPPACSEVSFGEAEEGPIVLRRPAASRNALARR